MATDVDALVSDEPINANIRHPPGGFESFGRSGTPSVPPGFGLPHGGPAQASPAISHSSLLGPSVGRQTPPVALPIIPAKPSATASSPLTGKKSLETSAPDAKKVIKTLAVESGLAKDIAKAKSQKMLQDEDFPALGTPKVSQSVVTPAASAKPTPVKAASTVSKKAAEKAPEKAEDKRQEKEEKEKTGASSTVKAEPRASAKKTAPVLNIAAATKAAQIKSAEVTSAGEKSSSERDSAFPALPTPTTASVSSPLARAAPKTLRVVPTLKTEVLPIPSAGVSGVLSSHSVKSVAVAAIRPETPASELISDSGSIISASLSVSRTNSPPPSKVGSAPVRATTKSQQRKQRKEALKKESATIAAQPINKPPENEVIAPIIGRKKKQKKEKEKSSGATPTVSRPESPLPQAPPPNASKEVKEKENKDESSTYRSTANETTTLTEDTVVSSKYSHKGEGAKMSEQSSAARSGPPPSASAVFQDLQKAGLMPENLESLAFFKTPTTSTDKSRNDAKEAAANVPMTPTKSIVSEEDQVTLLAGKPVRKIIDGVRVLLTPNGDCIRNLTEEEEDRFLELQNLIAEAASSPAAFLSQRHEAGGGFSLIKGRAVPNGPPSYFPPAPGTYTSDPVTKIQREEAIYYINQYVLPRLNLSSRDISFSGALTGFSPDGRANNTSAAAAANLSSLAPWIYGTAMAAQGGDTAAPELNYPGPVGAFADPAGHHDSLASYMDATSEPPFNPRAAMEDLLPVLHSTSAVLSSSGTKGVPASSTGAPGPFGAVPLMSYEDAEQALSLARKETEKLEKTLNSLIKKNRRMVSLPLYSNSH